MSGTSITRVNIYFFGCKDTFFYNTAMITNDFLQKKATGHPIALWSCGDSNSGPDKYRKCFLHAYSAFDCRVATEDEHPIDTVS